MKSEDESGLNPWSRSVAVLGAEAMRRLAVARALVVGVGGVGSWCAEALVRTGLGHIVLVDDDRVSPSNLNRQCQAARSTLGRLKVEALAERLRDIAPEGDIVARAERYPQPSLDLAAFDVIVDAIDSVDAKAELLLAATASGVPVVSSMGAALRRNPARARVTAFEKVAGDGLARALRQRFKRLGRFPAAKFACVWSDESPMDCAERGSLMTVTGTFGLLLANEVIALLTTR